MWSPGLGSTILTVARKIASNGSRHARQLITGFDPGLGRRETSLFRRTSSGLPQPSRAKVNIRGLEPSSRWIFTRYQDCRRRALFVQSAVFRPVITVLINIRVTAES